MHQVIDLFRDSSAYSSVKVDEQDVCVYTATRLSLKKLTYKYAYTIPI